MISNKVSDKVSNMNERTTIKESVYNSVFDDITEGVYKPNDILTENSLAEKYKVSKAPIREALIELCKDDVLHSLPRLGYQVVPISLKEVLDILEFRLDLEISSLKRAVSNISAENIRALRNIESLSEDGLGKDVVPNWMLNRKFHLELCKLYGNDYTYKILEETLKRSSRYISQYFNSAWSQSSESNGRYHNEIINALEKGDFNLACEVLSKDIMAVKEEIQKIYSFY